MPDLDVDAPSDSVLQSRAVARVRRVMSSARRHCVSMLSGLVLTGALLAAFTDHGQAPVRLPLNTEVAPVAAATPYEPSVEVYVLVASPQQMDAVRARLVGGDDFAAELGLVTAPRRFHFLIAGSASEKADAAYFLNQLLEGGQEGRGVRVIDLTQ